MRDALQSLLRKASAAKRTADFWQAAAQVLSDWAGGALLTVCYQGVNESGAVSAGAAGVTLTADWHDPEGRHVEASLAGAPRDLPGSDLESALEFASDLAVMVGRRVALERERRLGSFVVELARWLLAVPETELLLRYTLQSLMQLVDAQGAFVALKQSDGETLRISPALGQAAPTEGLELGLHNSTTGRVVRSGEALMSPDLRLEADSSPLAVRLADAARSALIAPLRTSKGPVGAVGLLRYQGPGPAPPPQFSLYDLHYLTAVAAHIASGMVDASPLPMALVDTGGTVQQLNEAALHVFGLTNKEAALGRHLEALGLSPSGVTVRLILAGRREGQPWHGRVLVTQESGDRRICDCTVTGLRGLGSESLLVALYDRTDELRAQRELIAREKLATVGEIASGVAHEVNNPLAAIRMEAELQQVVINLVTNAEHVVKGRDPAVIQLTTQAREGWVRLVVEDSGPGIPVEIRGRIFDPFFTTKGPDEGTGLGLAICQRVVTEVGGKIWLEDSALGGAKFVVELPAAPESVETTTIG